MAVLKCKMCGGDIVAEEGQTYGFCDSCGSTVTLPRVNDQRVGNLFNRANHFRLMNEFDRAMASYELILNEDDTNAEAHWGLLLSRYGIEYVEDPKSGERIPTCHRIQRESILSDTDYLAAVSFAPDSHVRGMYEAEAKRLAELQKSLLKVSKQSEAFDVFICYKETDASGSRTKDSAIAQDIYHQLTREGYRVFFSRVTLESVLGEEYEPYIFAALNSARVMLAIGTKPEYFNAVWVKNEWSRFLALSKSDSAKLLIPCYRDMNVYDLPDELSVLQSQDMEKIGFMQDILHGIEKVICEKKPTEESQDAAAAGPGVKSLVRRAQLFLEDGDFEQANEYFDRALDIDPEYAPAYIGKLCSELQVNLEEKLADAERPFDENGNYQKAVRFGDPEQKATYEGYHRAVAERLAAEEENRRRTAEEARIERERVQCETKYQNALQKKTEASGKFQFAMAAEEFERLGDYKDSAEQAMMCRAEIQRLEKEANTREEQRREQQKRESRIVFRATIIVSAILVALLIFSIVSALYINPNNDYNEALRVFEAGDYEAAEKMLVELKNYRNSNELLSEVRYRRARQYEDAGDSQKALSFYRSAGDYEDAKERAIAIFEETENQYLGRIAVGFNHGTALKADGTVISFYRKNRLNNYDMHEWTEITAVAEGSYHVLGIRSDKTVVAVGKNEQGQCEIGDWSDIIAVAGGESHSIGLKSDGTVVAAGSNEDGQCDINDWRNIIAISAYDSVTAGLKSDGTVLVAGNVTSNQGNLISQLEDIIAISVGRKHVTALCWDGTVVIIDENGGYTKPFWKDIIAIADSSNNTYGLRADGTVVGTGSRSSPDWEDIVTIAAGSSHVLGVRKDGQVVGANSYGGDIDVVQDWVLW